MPLQRKKTCLKLGSYEKSEHYKNLLGSAVLNILVTGLNSSEVSKFADDTKWFIITKAEWRESQKYLLIPKNKRTAGVWSS